MQELLDKGFEIFTFQYCVQVGELEPGVLDRLVEKSQNLSSLEIVRTNDPNFTDANRKVLAEMTKKIL